MKFLNVIAGLFDPLAKVIDATHTSTEEKLAARQRLFEAQATLFQGVIEYETKQLQSRSEIIQAEAKGQGILQRNWRPVTMLTFLVLVVANSFGWLASPLAPEAWTLLQLGLGGYVTGRSVEKIADKFGPRIKGDGK